MTVIENSEHATSQLFKIRTSPARRAQLEKHHDVPAATVNMRRGQRLVIAGFGIAIFGIVLYCMATFSTGFGQQEPVFIKESLGIIGAGTLVWLIGAVRYLNAAIDSNSSDEGL
tara:strand:- start:391 stop:732 length:342 start_codon:yes stop_codon:yes gene_type:complete